MIVEVRPGAAASAPATIAGVAAEHDDIDAWPVELGGRWFVVVAGDEALVPVERLEALDEVAAVTSTAATGFWLVGREGAAPSTVRIGETEVGGGSFWAAAGPCALEDPEDAVEVGKAVRAAGAHAFRIGAFKPRTSPHNFQGKGRRARQLLQELREAIDLPVVSEVLDPRDVGWMAETVDCLQIGTRNMTNQALLAEVGRVRTPVLLKRGASSPVVEWVRAAEYIAAQGNAEIVLCARGITSFDDSLRTMPDLSSVLRVREMTQLPVVFDPSHAAGRRSAVAPIALAASVFGVDGLLIECHTRPEVMHRPGDGDQAFDPAMLSALLESCAAVRAAGAAWLPARP